MNVHTPLLIGHIVGTAIGLGGASAADFIFFRCLRDGRINEIEHRTLGELSKLIMGGLVLLIVTGGGFLVESYLVTHTFDGLVSSKLAAKLIVVVIITINGAVMHSKVHPLVAEAVGKPLHSTALGRGSAIAMTCGAISVVSWYTALVLGIWRRSPPDFSSALMGYFLVLAVAILCANTVGRWLVHYVATATR